MAPKVISEYKRNVVVWLHFSAALVHFIFGGVILGLGFKIPLPDGSKGPLYSSLFFGVDYTLNGKEPITFDHFQAVPFLSGFELLTGLFHLITFFVAKFAPGIFFDDWLKNKMQPIRWIEYGFTDAWISFSFLNLVGVTNLMFLLQHIGLKMTMNFMGLICEYFFYCYNTIFYPVSRKEGDGKITSSVPNMILGKNLLFGMWLTFFIAWVPYLYAIAARIGLFAFVASGGGVPVFVWVSFFGYQFMELGFPIFLAASLEQWWIFDDYSNVEISLLATSLTVKLFFSSDILFGILGSNGKL